MLFSVVWPTYHSNEEITGETVTDFVSAGRFVAEPVKFVWSYDFHHKNFYYSVTGDYRIFKHLSCCISAMRNNHCGKYLWFS